MTTTASNRTQHGLALLLVLICTTVIVDAEVDLPTRAATCGVKHSNHFYYQRIDSKDRSNLLKLGHLMKRDVVTQIPVHWHLMKIDDTEVNGNIPLSRIQTVMQSLNNHHNGAGFNYFIASVDYIDVSSNTNLFFLAPYSRPQFIQQLSSTYRKGNMRHLNLYVADLTTDNVGGMTTYPWVSSPTMLSTDWSLLDTWAVMDHSDYPASYAETMAMTCAHEVGHWLGLFHTFENGCDAPGDYVDDTNPEAQAFSSGSTCSASSVCAGSPAPIDNLMDYGTCRSHFSAGQYQRMKEQFLLYRNVAIDQSVITYQGPLGQLVGAAEVPTTQQTSQQAQPQTPTSAIPTNNADQTPVLTSNAPTSKQAETSNPVDASTVAPVVETSNPTGTPNPIQTSDGATPIRPVASSAAAASSNASVPPNGNALTSTSEAMKTISVAISDSNGVTYTAMAKPEARGGDGAEDSSQSNDATARIALGLLAILPIVLLL